MRSSLFNKLLLFVLAVLILGLIVWLASLLTVPPVSEKFTEFYVLDLQGKTSNYPFELKIGETGRVIVGITNMERDTVDYTLEVIINGKREKTVGPISLKDKGKWQNEVSFTPASIGYNQKVEFILYRVGESKPYRGPLFLWVNVR